MITLVLSIKTWYFLTFAMKSFHPPYRFKNRLATVIFLSVVLLIALSFSAQPTYSQESIEVTGSEYGPDGVPVLIKNLPDWKEVLPQTKWIDSQETLVAALGQKSILESIDFSTAVEAVVAEYPEGRLLLLEYGTPQLSSDADARFTQALKTSSNNGSVIYRRIGNYNAFLFDAKDEVAANKLLDKIYYGKLVQWLGEDPNIQEKLDRYFASTTAQVFFSTVKVIVIGLGFAIVIGSITGFLFFRHREKQRRQLKTFSDAGGMIRINLDGLSDQPWEDNSD